MIFPAFISHDKSGLSYHDGNTENSLNFVTSDDKRDRGIATSDCSLHRNVKRNGSNRSRNSPPVYLALKSHHEFVDIDSTEVSFLIFLMVNPSKVFDKRTKPRLRFKKPCQKQIGFTFKSMRYEKRKLLYLSQTSSSTGII